MDVTSLHFQLPHRQLTSLGADVNSTVFDIPYVIHDFIHYSVSSHRVMYGVLRLRHLPVHTGFDCYLQCVMNAQYCKLAT